MRTVAAVRLVRAGGGTLRRKLSEQVGCVTGSVGRAEDFATGW